MTPSGSKHLVAEARAREGGERRAQGGMADLLRCVGED